MFICETNMVYFGTNKGNWIFLNLASLFPVLNRMYFQLQIECLIIFKGISSVQNPLSRLYLALFSHTNNSFKAHWTIVFSDAYVQSSNITYYVCGISYPENLYSNTCADTHVCWRKPYLHYIHPTKYSLKRDELLIILKLYWQIKVAASNLNFCK